MATNSNYLHFLARSIGHESYDAYLESDYWKKFSKEVRRPLCFCCGDKKRLHVHHLTYERLGKELPTDVVTVCQGCHQKIHKLVRNKKTRLEDTHFKIHKPKPSHPFKKQKRSRKNKPKKAKRPWFASESDNPVYKECGIITCKLDRIKVAVGDVHDHIFRESPVIRHAHWNDEECLLELRRRLEKAARTYGHLKAVRSICGYASWDEIMQIDQRLPEGADDHLRSIGRCT